MASVKRQLSSRLNLLVLLLLLVPIVPSNSFPSIKAATGASIPAFHDTLLAGASGTMLDVAWTPDGRILVPMQSGQLRIYAADDTLLTTAALNLFSVTCTDDERGIGGIAVHPNFASNHYIYVYYTYKKFGTCNQSETNGPVNRLSRFALSNTNTVDPASERVLLDTPPLPTSMHNAGDVKFGKDGNLYVTVGDGGTACCSSHPDWPSDPGVLFGKILRVTDSGGIPPTNPFVGAGTARCNVNGVPPSGSPPATKCQEVYAVGLRNPFRFAFDPNSSEVRFFINDVGEDTWEEIDQGQAAADYGWPQREGPCAQGSTTDCNPPPPGVTGPVYWYGHNVTINSNSCTAITGGAFVPKGVWPGIMDDSYLYVDFICGQVWQLIPNGEGGFVRSEFFTLEPTGPVSMRFGPYGTSQALFYVTYNGQLHRIAYTGFTNENFRMDWSDYDNNGVVTLQDIASAVLFYDHSSNYWDLNRNGRVDISDVATAALLYGRSFQVEPYPGQGLLPGTVDPSWKPSCGQLPQPDQAYCNNT